MKKLVDGQVIDLTTEEITARQAEESQSVSADDLIGQTYEQAKRLLQLPTLRYSEGEMIDWRRTEDEAWEVLKGKPAKRLKKEIAGMSKTESEYATDIVTQAVVLERFKTDVINARNKHKEAIATLTAQQRLTYDTSLSWPIWKTDYLTAAEIQAEIDSRLAP